MKQLLLIIVGFFILLMSIEIAVEIRNGYKQASELERYLYENKGN